MTGQRRPKGILVAIGGNEDKEKDRRILRRVAGLTEGSNRSAAQSVGIIPTASEEPEETAEAYIEAYQDLGIQDVRVFDIRTRQEASDEATVKSLRECEVVYLTGGDQLRLTSILGGSPVLEGLMEHYWNGGVVAGTSAGAAAMSGTMIFEGTVEASMRKGNVQMVPGLGLLRNAVIDTHFIHRGRLSRLIEVVASNPGAIGLGLGEDTGVIVRQGSVVEAIGAGVVVVVEGHEIRYTNISKIPIGDPIGVEHMILHTLVEGASYDLANQRYLPPRTARKAGAGAGAGSSPPSAGPPAASGHPSGGRSAANDAPAANPDSPHAPSDAADPPPTKVQP